MERSKAARKPAMMTFHSLVIASMLSAQSSAYVGLRSGGWACADASLGARSHRHHPKQHPHQRGCLVRHRRRRRQGGRLEATLQGGTDAPGGEENDHWEDAETRAVMEQFKRSVLDERGRVRQMTDRKAAEVAGAAADGILKLAERKVRSKLPPPPGLFDSDDPSAAAAAAGSYADESSNAAAIRHQFYAAIGQEEEEGDGELEEEEALLDWGNDRDRLSGVGMGEGRGPGRHPLRMESREDGAEYESILAALKAYHAQHGNLLLTHKYHTTPTTSAVESAQEEGEGGTRGVASSSKAAGMVEHQGWRLGQKAYNMKFWKKHIRDRPSRREELAKLGFVWERLQDEYNLFLEALLAYRDIEGSLLVPSSFVVPEEEPWPLCCQGMRLGAKVAGVRNQSLYVRADVARWYQLDAMGFVWDLSDAPFRQVFDALVEYKAQHGNLHVPVAFQVPSCPPWSEDLWGLAVGQRVLDIRARHRYIRNDPDRIRMLNQIGFQWTDAAKTSYANVVRALKAYRRVKGRDFSVPSSFVVPSFLPWPQSCWGLRLGTALVDIRSKGSGSGDCPSERLSSTNEARAIEYEGEDRQQRRLELERLGVFTQSRVRARL
eukprot:jgi/Undpi1/11907/HiC_scaffold_4.g01606.m1